jgi:AcrR family transcriptional regulator
LSEDKVMIAPKPVRKKNRISRHEWLGLAMEILSRHGGARLNVNNLCEAMGVTKGSFYAHFESRDDFVRQFIAFWDENFTRNVVTAVDELKDSTGQVRLLALMQLLHREKLARYDIAVRAWAAQEPEVAKGVQEVDAVRFGYIRSIFHDMGFRRGGLDVRTRMFVVFHSAVAGMQLPPSRQGPDAQIEALHAFFTRP